MRTFPLLEAVFLGFVFASAQAQQNRPVSDPQAVAFAAQSVAAIAGRSNLDDLTLTGNATFNKQGSGTFKLSALGNAESRMDLALSNGTTTVIRDVQSGVPRGEWIASNGRSGRFSSLNCWTDAAWFFPALGALASTPNIVLTYIGKEIRNGVEVEHIHSYVYQAGQTSAFGSQKLSAMDFYLDAATFIPIATTFNAHPDNDASTNLLIEVDFADYQRMNGILVPTHIQRNQQGTLMLDLVVTGASINSRPPLALFAVK